jgi:hypothetical protein
MDQAEIDKLRSAMRASQVFGKGVYVEEGRHRLMIDKVICQRTEIDGAVKETYLAECKVIASTNPSHEVGSTRTYAESTKNKGWMGRWKAFLAAAAGADPGKLSPTDQETISDMIAAIRYDEFRAQKRWPENFLHGRVVDCEGMPGKSQGGTPITNKKWSPVAPAQ